MASPLAGVRARSGLYGQTVEYLGREIVDGNIPEGGKLFADQLCEELGISRSVVREALRTLGSMGLVESRPQVGTRVLPFQHWDLLNPYVVRWRAQGPSYLKQMRQLLELRMGVEPYAASLAAARMSAEQAEELVGCAQQMEAAANDGNVRQYFDLDAKFHRLVLEGTDNRVIAQLADAVSETLNSRGVDTRPEMLNLTETSVKFHLYLADAIAARDPLAARAAAETLVQHTLTEFGAINVGSTPKDRAH